MTRGKMDVRGADSLERVLNLLPEKVAKKTTENALRAGARVIRDEARRQVPVRTGALKRSIVVATTKRGSRGERVRLGGVVFVGFRKPHSRRAHLTEFGTSTQAAQPFMRPAIDTKGQEAIKVLAQKLNQGIQKDALEIAGRFRDIRRSTKRLL